MRNLLFCFLLLLGGLSLHAQQVITGKVRSTDNDSSLAGASVSVKGTSIGTVTDETGNFKVQVSSLPITLVITHTGFATQEIILRANEPTVIILEREIPLDPIVIAPTRTRGTNVNSPMSVEVIGAKQIVNMPGSDYYAYPAFKKGN
jgi:hypothetical protein